MSSIIPLRKIWNFLLFMKRSPGWTGKIKWPRLSAPYALPHALGSLAPSKRLGETNMGEELQQCCDVTSGVNLQETSLHWHDPLEFATNSTTTLPTTKLPYCAVTNSPWFRRIHLISEQQSLVPMKSPSEVALTELEMLTVPEFRHCWPSSAVPNQKFSLLDKWSVHPNI